MSKKIKMINIIAIVLSVISIILLFTTLKPCEKGMKCRPFTFVFIGLLGVGIVFGVLSLIFKKKWLSILPAIILPIGMLIDKNIVGLCKVATMRCNTITYPSIVVITTILTVLYIVLIILNYKKQRNFDE